MDRYIGIPPKEVDFVALSGTQAGFNRILQNPTGVVTNILDKETFCQESPVRIAQRQRRSGRNWVEIQLES